MLHGIHERRVTHRRREQMVVTRGWRGKREWGGAVHWVRSKNRKEE
jgi:hypothetical protein